MCNQNNNLVPEMATIPYEGERTMVVESGTYFWMATVAGSNCSQVLIYLQAITVKNGARIRIILSNSPDQPDISAEIVVEAEGGPTIWLPIVSNQPQSE